MYSNLILRNISLFVITNDSIFIIYAVLFFFTDLGGIVFYIFYFLLFKFTQKIFKFHILILGVFYSVLFDTLQYPVRIPLFISNVSNMYILYIIYFALYIHILISYFILFVLSYGILFYLPVSDSIMFSVFYFSILFYFNSYKLWLK